MNKKSSSLGWIVKICTAGAAVGLTALGARAEAPQDGISQEAGASYSYSPSAGVERAGVKTGEVKVQNFAFDYRLGYQMAPGTRLLAGVNAGTTELGVDGAAALPDRLRAVGLMAGVNQNLAEWWGPGWSTTALVRTVWTSTEANLSGAGVAVQGVWTANYQQSATLAWNAGLVAGTHGRYAVLPVAGVRWNFAPDWTLAAGFPETKLAYSVTPQLGVKLAASFLGGSYHVEKAPAAGLGNTYLDYHEIRVGLGADYTVAPGVTVGAEAGAVVNRRFDYFDRDTKIEGRSAGYVALSLRARF